MGRLAGFTYRDVIKKLRRLGWVFDRQAAGSHEIWRQAESGRKVTVPNHPGDLAEGTLRAILRQGPIDIDDFLDAQAGELQSQELSICRPMAGLQAT